ncbi:hypothetical protein IGI04_026129 [Brassica rapa subsp. trilocularis]|uniref:Uncharacterized protein n=1 Tax=Brassica rapa subsp. trilocularis TaxID=1813537 RepID=A0ABQ7KVE2_BRACM|nr:hypothetical protein IGI04_026129 [Brassica rapa subsp. trilocularis]
MSSGISPVNLFSARDRYCRLFSGSDGMCPTTRLPKMMVARLCYFLRTTSAKVLQIRAQLVFVHALSWGRPTAEPLKKMNKLIIKVEVKIVQAFDKRDVSGREMVDSNGFQVLCTQVCMEEIGKFREEPRSGHVSVARASLDQSVLTRNS